MKRLESQLKDLAREAEPQAAFKATLWQQLESEFPRLYPTTPLFFRRAFAIPMAAMVLFISTGTGVYAYASPSVTQDHSLYPVKRGMEAVEELVPRSSVASARFYARMMERRLAESEYLLNRNKFQAAVLDTVVEELEQAIDEVDAPVKNEIVREKALQQISVQASRYGELVEAVNKASADGSLDDREKLRNVLERARVRISESALSDEEKQDLLDGLEPTRDASETPSLQTAPIDSTTTKGSLP